MSDFKLVLSTDHNGISTRVWTDDDGKTFSLSQVVRNGEPRFVYLSKVELEQILKNEEVK